MDNSRTWEPSSMHSLVFLVWLSSFGTIAPYIYRIVQWYILEAFMIRIDLYNANLILVSGFDILVLVDDQTEI